MTELVADPAPAPAGNGSTGFFQGALSASIILHAALIGGASLALSWPSELDESGEEAIAVDIVTWQEFSSTVAAPPIPSSAPETIQSAGAMSVAAVEPAEVPQIEAATPVAAETALPPEALSPTPVAPVAPTTAASVGEMAAPAQAVVASAAAAVETVSPVRAETVAASATSVASSEPVQPVIEQMASLTPDVLEPLPEELQKAEKPKPVATEAKKPKKQPAEKPKEEPKPKKKQATAAVGNGGKSEADAAAASSAPSGKGKSGTAGNGAVDKYPGVVQRQLRRALRFPKGAGRARGEVHVQFVVSASGGASQISVVKTSGEPIIDEAAIATVKRAAPFPPIPPEAGKSTWTFTIPLRFAR